MNKIEKEKKELVWQADLGGGMYCNPILYMDYSDPDVIRVGDTYYMTASSFNYVPGLPILTSKNLVNWELVNFAVKTIPYDRYKKPAHGKGVWAPCIRYHDSYFWICVGMPDEGIFMTKTKDPYGEWGPFVCIREAKGFIDPCPFWDEDGRAYVVHAYANSRIGFKSKLGIFEIDPEGTKAISEDIFIFDGTKTQPTIEGPKIYKTDDMYYILAPAGGVKAGWQTALRSKSIYGPYEEKIVMHQGNALTNGPHQGGLIDTVGGEKWFLHFQYKGVYGRIIHLQPVNWKDGWPIIGVDNENIGIGEPVLTYRKPDGVIDSVNIEPDTSDEFTKETLGLQWQWLANYRDDFYSLTEKAGSLCLYPINTTGTTKALLWESANVLTQKIATPSFVAETTMDYSMLPVGARAGMIIIGGQYAALYVERQQEGYKVGYLESLGIGDLREEQIIEKKVIDTGVITIQIEFNEDGKSVFTYQINECGDSIPTRAFSPEGAMWVGAKIGMFAISDFDEVATGKVFFDYFRVERR